MATRTSGKRLIGCRGGYADVWERLGRFRPHGTAFMELLRNLMNTNIISKYLQLLRKKHNYTQDELAKKLDISRQAVSKLETGAAIPDLEILLKISKLYGITINDILEPNISTKKITDFEQLSKVPENELREILEQFDMASLVTASMGASPEINNLLEKLFPEADYKIERNCIGRVRVDEVERIQQEIVSVINLRALDHESL